MAASYLRRFLGIMRGLEREMIAILDGLSATAARELMRQAGPNGRVPVDAMFGVQDNIGAAVMRIFVGRTSQSTRAPFLELPNGDVIATTPYSRTLFDHVDKVEELALEQHRNLMVQMAENNPAIRANAIFRPNPLAQFERAHTWVDPSGYKLSDRIWRTAGQTRRKLDLFLDERIRQGQGALDMARDLETFLKPGRTLRTERPYGIDASYDAMRLARTEISRAHARASEEAAMMNPFVKGVGIRLSGSHPKPDICDDAAAASPFPKGEIPARFQIPMHPHCLCTYYYEMVDNPDEIMVQQLEAIFA